MKFLSHNKIAVKLSFYFSISLILLSIVMGSIFIVLFKNHTVDIFKSDLEVRAVKIAKTLSDFNDGNHKMGSGYGAYVRFISDIAGCDVWIVDQNYNLITSRHGNTQNEKYVITELPENAMPIIKKVLENKTIFSEDFSNELDLAGLTITVGTPIVDKNQNVVGAVLLHAPVNGTDHAIQQGLFILFISISVALIITIILASIFSIYFTKPLRRMNENALKLAKGNFNCRNNIHMNDEIGELAVSLDTLTLQLEQADKLSKQMEQMKHDFVANVSHELKTPITVIRGSLEALMDKVVTDEKKVERYYHQMYLETRNLERLIADLLELSKLQNIEFLIEKKNLSLSHLIEDVSHSIQFIADKKDIKIQLFVDEEEQSFYGDYGRLRQMLMVILDNAVKFSKEQGTIDLKLENKKIHIRDYGTGIEEGDLPHIFERFYKSRSEINKSGTGLGLAIAHQIAMRHDILVTVNSKLGEGTEFIFDFGKLP